MRRIFLALFIVTFSAVIFAQKFDYVYKGIEFRCKLENGAVTITRFDEKARNVTIPATAQYKGLDYDVKKVSTFLNGVNYLTINLVIEEGIEDIDKFNKVYTVAILNKKCKYDDITLFNHGLDICLEANKINTILRRSKKRTTKRNCYSKTINC